MPLVAVALAVSTLLHAGSSALSWMTLSSLVFSTPITTTHVVFEPNGQNGHSSESSVRWVAPHTVTNLWSDSSPNADQICVVPQWAPLQVVGSPEFGRIPVWNPSTRAKGWVRASHVGPVDPRLVGSPYLPPIGRPIAWGGPARVTMYTCVELGGCAATASGLWPEPGMVAVDPKVIPLGSTVWIQGLGTFLAADTGSLVRGAHLDVYGLSYPEALEWGVQERSVLVFAPG
jgi:3D (Asp-Asp-Asp) domain-containing protein